MPGWGGGRRSGSQSRYGRSPSTPAAVGWSGRRLPGAHAAANLVKRASSQSPCNEPASRETARSRARRSTRSARASTSAATSRSAAATWSSSRASSARPAYVYAEDDIRARARAYLEAFRARTDDFEVIYASKAAPFVAACRVAREEGLSIDVASGRRAPRRAAGRVRARADLPARQQQDRGRAPRRDRGRGRLRDRRLVRRDRAAGAPARPPAGGADQGHARHRRLHPLLRPDRPARLEVRVRARRRAAPSARVEAIRASSRLRLVGLHAHIGSQIFELEPYTKAIEALAGLAGDDCRLLNVGGGLGIAYTAEDSPPSIEDYVDVKVRGVRAVFDHAAADPGRARPLDRRQRRDHGLHRRHGQGDPGRSHLRRRRRRHVGQHAADALRLALRGC